MRADEFSCAQCHRKFSRREHLDRHLLTHSNERPFTCSHCSKSFARRDVFQKHLRTHEFIVATPLGPRKNNAFACDNCHSRKVKCEQQKPCSRCRVADLACTYERGQQQSSNAEVVGDSDGLDMAAAEIQDPGLLGSIYIPDLPATEMSGNGTYLHDANGHPGFGNTSHCNEGMDFTLDFAFNDSFMPESYMPIYTDPFDTALMASFQDGFFENLAIDYGWNPSSVITSDLGSGDVARHVGLDDNNEGALQEKQQRLDAAYTKLNEYSTIHYPSRPNSPRTIATHQRYVQELGDLGPLSDDLITNVFKGLFYTYVAPTFPCFRLSSMKDTAEEVHLGIAAAGGLFCSALKSEVIATWLHHYSRRKLLTAAYTKQAVKSARKIDLLEAWTLTEIFAFLSGDKRCMSLLDIYHAQLMKALRSCKTDISGSGSSEKFRAVLETVQILECYRVVLMQRPPMLNLLHLEEGLVRVSDSPPPAQGPRKTDSILTLLESFTSLSRLKYPIEDHTTSMQSLCALSILQPNGQTLLRPPSTGEGTTGSEVSSKYSTAFFEIALQNWLSSHSVSIQPGTLMLYHMIHVSMYTSFASTERVANDYLMRRKESKAGATSSSHQTSLDGRGEPLPGSGEARHEVQAKVAWHAEKILTISESMKPELCIDSSQRVHLSLTSRAAREGEITHRNHAIYYASMILWTLSVDGSRKSIDSNALRRGIAQLSLSPSRIASVFKQTLQRLENVP